MSTLASNSADIRRYVETLFGSADSGHLPVWNSLTKRTNWVPVGDTDSIVAACIELGARGNVYTGVGLHSTPLGEHSRGRAASVSGIPGLWLDLDLAGPGHKTTNLPPASAAQHLITSAVPVAPTYVINSGGGLHVYWLFKEFWVFAGEAERHHAARLARALQWMVITAAREHDWTVDNTADLARVLRPAGTINRKAGLLDRPVRVLQEPRHRYSIEDLEAILPLDDRAFPHMYHQTRVPRSGPTRVPAALWSRITAQCPYMAHCEDDAATLSEPEWHAMMSVLGRCHKGETIAHRVSAPYPSYDADETAKKFAYAIRADAPMRCDTIRTFRGGEPWCSRCPHWGRIPSPITLGYAPRYYHQSAPHLGQELAL
jgi:putative DNA primase/helicase